MAALGQRVRVRRGDDKCEQDPSLGVAHGCFWKYHPAKAYAWELRWPETLAPVTRGPGTVNPSNV